MSANPRKQDSLEKSDAEDSTSKATSAQASSSPYGSTEFQALRSGPSYLQQNLGTDGVGLEEVLDSYDELEDEEEHKYHNAAQTGALDNSEVSGEAEGHMSNLQTSLPPIKNNYRLGKDSSYQGLIPRMRKGKEKEKKIDRLIPEHPREQHSGDNLLPDSGMSKMLEDDMRAQNVLLKALKEKLTANLERLKRQHRNLIMNSQADEAMLLHMFDMTDKDLENSKPLYESDQRSKRQLSQHEEADAETWKDISKKLKRTHKNEEGGTAVQGQYVAHSLQESPSFDLISENEDEEAPEEYEDEDAALKALNQMISEFADDESN